MKELVERNKVSGKGLSALQLERQQLEEEKLQLKKEKKILYFEKLEYARRYGILVSEVYLHRLNQLLKERRMLIKENPQLEQYLKSQKTA